MTLLWIGVGAAGSVVVIGGLLVAASVGEYLARRDVPISDEEPMWLERLVEHVQSGVERFRRWRRP